MTTAPPANDAATSTTANSALRIGCGLLALDCRDGFDAFGNDRETARPTQGNAVLGEYPRGRGWGGSAIGIGPEIARSGKVKSAAGAPAPGRLC